MRLTNIGIYGLLLIGATAQASEITTTFIHTDHLGSPVMATNEDGSVKWREDYEPFGKQLTNQDTDNIVGYTGHMEDKSLDLTYMQARWYHAEVGRFMSLDPIGYSEENPVMSFNRYAYVNNNPYKYNDPDGEFLNFAIKFVADVAMGVAINYMSGGGLNIAAAVKESAQGILNPAKSIQKAKRLVSAISKTMKRTCCFVAGTEVLSESGYKNIEDIQLGEKLWAKNTETGEQDWKPVTKIFIEADRGIYEITLIGIEGITQTIEATDDHPFYVIGKGWRTTLELMAGDQIETDGNGAMTLVSVHDEQRLEVTYNFTVADFNTYYVTKRNVLVHNCGIKMKDMGTKAERTSGDIKDVRQAVTNAGNDAEKLNCAKCKLETSIENRVAENVRQGADAKHTRRITQEREELQRVERKLKNLK